MNKNSIIKILLCSFIFLFIYCYSSVDVFAESCTCQPGDTLISSTVKEDGSVECVCEDVSNTKCKDFYDENGDVILDALVEKYNAKITDAGNNQWKVTIDPSDQNDSSVLERLKDVRFKLMTINKVPVTYDAYVAYGDPLTVGEQLDADGYMSLVFRVDKNHPDPDCASEYLEFELEIMDGGEPKYETEIIPDITVTEPVSSNTINCGSPNGTFEVNFCNAKAAAKSSDPSGSLKLNFEGKFNNGSKYANKVGANTFTKFTCNSSQVRSKDEIASIGEDGYYLSENTSYMYGSGTYNMNFGSYSYHFEPCNATSLGTVTCSIRCEEAITVQYGAPVASKAGLCFEYKVKVTSRVTCEMETAPTPPQKITTVCTPTPTCTGIGRSGKRYYLTQGGPNEEFDRCVESCDGGKYTSSCSKKCYRQVYQDALISYSPKKSDSSCCNNCYTSSSTWKGSGPGRYYGGSCKSGYVPDGSGFCRHDYGGGRICQDDCWWSGCSGNVYLNPGYAEDDYEANMAKYQDAIDQCNAAASCSTSTAEFTISVDYTDGESRVQTIEFPYSGNTPIKDTANPSTITNNNSTLLRSQGCYDSPATSENLYLVEWGFPGSWINRKTGELSYLNKTGVAGWQEVADKFCIPFDAQDVNVDWWNYYYTKLGQNPVCPQNSVPSVDYNIHAKAKNFGYYGWNIAIDCFYAVNNTEKMPCDPPDTDDGDIKYVIRSIDLDDVFPNTDGTELVDNSSEIGRTPGFNWSASAYNTKNSNYVSSPLDYALRIQEKGYTIYSDDDQLDYKFRLTPTVLKELKNARSSDYTTFNGNNYTDDKGVIRYRSDLALLSDSSITLKKPTAAALLCNNMIGRSSCESHTS